MLKKQNDVIHALSDRQMIQQLYLTQLILAIAGLAASFIFLGNMFAPAETIGFNIPDILYGAGLAAGVIGANWVMVKTAPAEWYDDGGINEKLFRSCSIPHIALMAACIAMTEEWLFRGVLQTEFGLAAASIIFSVLHIRYLSKILLFSMVTAVSLLIGILYDLTGNLITTVIAHFLIDFIFGVQIRKKYLNRGES
ncbi:CPBP family intramembrane metalloprotease [Bacillus sp. FJAT-42376]|uniref:CPBP family intramembrane glutamic endopeptidase n=1 Tax=Bacillus sp. FJAT-42376 TaxID=2014076 RepID=UPI000F4E174E|nr:CPBP family intramembrane glutamic endopeptidase [Bacillus sp. FJAT-42376]AZB43370.1 CPBP family intramembrane metalloprotease [Bacillus sp. FJAT-42376]